MSYNEKVNPMKGNLMNLKKDIKDIGYYLITPLPQKYHFEGVDNRRAGRNLTVIALTAQVAVIGWFIGGPIVMDVSKRLTSRVKNHLKKN
jgi:hypothetical protein